MRITALKSKILWKIYLAWLIKRIIPLILLEIIIVVGATYLITRLVFVEMVVDNAFLNSASSPLRLAKFLFLAFLSTHWIIKIGIIIFLCLGALLLRDLGRTLASYRSTSKAAKRVKPN